MSGGAEQKVMFEAKRVMGVVFGLVAVLAAAGIGFIGSSSVTGGSDDAAANLATAASQPAAASDLDPAQPAAGPTEEEEAVTSVLDPASATEIGEAGVSASDVEVIEPAQPGIDNAVAVSPEQQAGTVDVDQALPPVEADTTTSAVAFTASAVGDVNISKIGHVVWFDIFLPEPFTDLVIDFGDGTTGRMRESAAADVASSITGDGGLIGPINRSARLTHIYPLTANATTHDIILNWKSEGGVADKREVATVTTRAEYALSFAPISFSFPEECDWLGKGDFRFKWDQGDGGHRVDFDAGKGDVVIVEEFAYERGGFVDATTQFSSILAAALSERDFALVRSLTYGNPAAIKPEVPVVLELGDHTRRVQVTPEENAKLGCEVDVSFTVILDLYDGS